METREIIGTIIMAVIFGSIFILFIILGIATLIDKIKLNKLKKSHPELFELMNKYWKKKNTHSYFYWENVYKIKEEIDKKVKEQKYLTKKDIIESNKEIEKLRETLKQNKEQSDKLYNESEKLHKQLIKKIEELPKYKNLIYNYYGIKETNE